MNKNNKYILLTITFALFALLGIFILIMSGGSFMNNKATTPSTNTTEMADGNVTDEATTSDANPAHDAIEEATTQLSKQQRKELINFKADFPYLIKINRSENFTIIYGIDKKGQYTIPYKGFWCSTGEKKKYTPLGSFNTSDKYTWRLMVDYSYAQYAIRINGSIMLHSVPYYNALPDSLESEEYNKLGSPASLGCIRFNVKNIKWIYDNCPVGTQVIVYDLDSETPPIKMPELIKLDLNDSRSNWDPTDPNSGNPWKKKKKTIQTIK